MTLRKPQLTQRIVVRATPAQQRAWVRLANAERRTLANWIRTVLDAAAGIRGERTEVETEDERGT